MSNPNDNGRASERTAPAQAQLDAVTRSVTDRVTARPKQRIVIRTAENRFGDLATDFANKPDGMDYGWKVKTVNGKEAKEAMLAWRLNGWTPVPAGRHPEFTGESADSQAEIERGGQVLCERPMEITQESKAMEKQAARDQVQTQMDRLAGRAKQTGSERVTKLKRSYEPINADE